jgi:hypothetical protein
MPPRVVRIRLAQRAIDAARQPRRAAAPALHPQALAILGEGTPDPTDEATRIVTCTIPEARALLDHFDGLCESLAGLGDPDAVLCADSRDTIRRAIVAAGA